MRNIYAIIIIFFMVFSCYASNRRKNTQIFVGESLNGIRIAWNYNSIQKLAKKGGYPRLLRLKDSSIIVVYENHEGSIVYKRSYDNGNSWLDSIMVFERFLYTNEKTEAVFINMANPEIIQLHNGDIVIGCNYRPQKNEIAPFSIAIRRSTDNGDTWLNNQVLYDAAPRFNDGCWEPAFLQLPDGKLQIYFANENPYQNSNEQEIAMLSSLDNGKTWTSIPKTISFRKGKRDGMPVPAIIGDEIVVVIEDNYIDKFKPYTVRTKLYDNWNSSIWGNSPEREYALSENINDSVYMGAPYLINLPGGETLISYQTNENRLSDIRFSTMEVAIGDSSAHNFAKRTRPFDIPLNREANWNSLALLDNHTVVALTSTNLDSDHVAPYIIKGYIIPEIVADKNKIDNYPIFIGSKGNINLWAGIANDSEILHIICKLENNQTHEKIDLKSGVSIYIAPNPSETESYRFWSDHKGNIACQKFINKQWIDLDDNIFMTVSTLENAEGYELDFEIPMKILPKSEIRMNIALSVYDITHSIYTEPVINSSIDEIGSWLKVKLN